MDDAVTIETTFMGFVDLTSPNKEMRPNITNAKLAHKKLSQAKFKRSEVKLPSVFLDGYDTQIIVIVC
jgi:hypothetical protein